MGERAAPGVSRGWINQQRTMAGEAADAHTSRICHFLHHRCLSLMLREHVQRLPVGIPGQAEDAMKYNHRPR